MFGRAFKIGTLLGFRLEISFSFLIILALFMFMNGIVTGLVLAAVVFTSVVLHELGHAVVARRLGIAIRGIELHILGGAAKMARMPKTARDEILIAIAGPGVSFALGAAGLAAYFATRWTGFGTIALINLGLGVFNLLPALPMDGGRVLRAALSQRMGRYRATHVAATVAQVFAVLFVVAAIALKAWMMILLAILLWFLASQERAMAGMWRYEDEMPPTEVLDEYGRVIAGRQVNGPGAVYNTPAEPAAGAAGAQGPVRRIYRLPNGTVMVVEETIRW
ncbi:MAG: M50 family metallopeptidase [bacterium]